MFRQANESADRLRRPVKRSPTDMAHEMMDVLFTPVATFLHRIKVTPNTITIVGCGFSLLGGALIATGHWPAAIGVIVFAGLLDGVDGLLARQSRQITPFGAFLDSVLDRWSDSAFFVGLLIWAARSGMMLQEVLSIVALASSLLVSYTRARAEGIGAECRRGLFTRLERFIVLVAGLVLNQMTIALWVMAGLGTVTAIQRIYYTWRYMEAHAEG